MPVKEPEDIPEQHGSVCIAEEAEDIVEIDFLEIQLSHGKQQHRGRDLVMVHVVYSHDEQGIDHHRGYTREWCCLSGRKDCTHKGRSDRECRVERRL